MPVVNVATCELPEIQAQGRFRFRAAELGELLGGRRLGAAVYEMEAGETNWPYHHHRGVEEWMYVVAGTPMLRDRSGQRPLPPGTLVAFASGPAGAHTVAGPGRVVIFSAGAAGWDSAWASVYPDSDKVSVRGAMFRRADALAAWSDAPLEPTREPAADGPCPSVDLMAVDVSPLRDDPAAAAPAPGRGRGRRLGPALGARTWAATVWELSPGESTAPYHHETLQEEWALVLTGAIGLRNPDGEAELAPHHLVGFPEGQDGAHQLTGLGPDPARVLVISTPVGQPNGTLHTEEDRAVLRLSENEGFRFRLSDRITDYWDGEPGAS